MDRHVRSRRVVATTLSASLIDFCEPLGKPIRTEIVIFSGPTTVLREKGLPSSRPFDRKIENCVPLCSPRSMYQFHSGSPYSFHLVLFRETLENERLKIINFYQIDQISLLENISPRENRIYQSRLALSIGSWIGVKLREENCSTIICHSRISRGYSLPFVLFSFGKSHFHPPPNQPPSSPLAWLKMTNYALDCAFLSQSRRR